MEEIASRVARSAGMDAAGRDLVMGHKLLIVAVLLLGGVGCRACGSGCYDYLPPVADGPYTSHSGRAGSAFGPMAQTQDTEFPDPAEEVVQNEDDAED